MNKENGRSRRFILQAAVVAPLLVFAGSKAAEAAEVCVDMTDLTDSEISLRKAQKFELYASDQTKTCSDCAFFKASSATCGTCQILMGPVAPKSHCTSWAMKK
jgi:hypothetical protein